MKSFAEPENEKQKHYSKCQEAARKDVERSFGVLHARFHIIRRPCRFMKLDSLQRVMKACVILHNKIVADEINDDFASEDYLDFTTSETDLSTRPYSTNRRRRGKGRSALDSKWTQMWPMVWL